LYEIQHFSEFSILIFGDNLVPRDEVDSEKIWFHRNVVIPTKCRYFCRSPSKDHWAFISQWQGLGSRIKNYAGKKMMNELIVFYWSMIKMFLLWLFLCWKSRKRTGYMCRNRDIHYIVLISSYICVWAKLDKFLLILYECFMITFRVVNNRPIGLLGIKRQ
jgi:hypothetical protein